MAQLRQLLVMAGHAELDGVVFGPRVDDAPHGVGDLFGGLGRGATAHLVDQGELEALDLLLGGAFPQRGARDAAQLLLPGAIDHSDTTEEVVRGGNAERATTAIPCTNE